MWRGIVGKRVDVAGFQDHVANLKFNGWVPSFVVVHNTSAPTVALYRQWLTRKNWTPEQWARNLESYYIGQGWNAGPHAFVLPDGGILLFTPFTVQGTHSPAWNSRTWGIETVGEFQTETFEPGIRQTLVSCLGILHARVGLDPEDYKFGVRGLHLHKEDPKTTHKECPGIHVEKASLVRDVAAYVEALHPGGHEHISEAVHTADTSSLTDEERTSVTWLQSSINKVLKEEHVAVDGRMGPRTKLAVLHFQKQHPPLVADGIAGPLTRIILKQAVGQ